MKRFLLIALLIVSPFMAVGQLNNTQDISISINPSTPEPGDTVNIEATSFATDLNRADLRWSVDGQVVLEGRGESRIRIPNITARSYSVTLTARTSDLGSIVKTVSFTPASVELLWEATNSYIPDSYKGKALVAHDGGVIVQAFPELFSGSTQLDPRTLIYKWSVNDKPRLADSGVGKTTFEFGGPVLYRNAVVTLDVESPNGSIRARRSLSFAPTQPQIIFYRTNPLFGENLLSPIFGQMTLSADENVVRAEPYYFSDISNERVLEFDWEVDGRDVVTIGDRQAITLRRPEQGSGRSNVSLEIRHIGKILQFGRANFRALFDADTQDAERNRGDTNFFGN